MITRCVFLAEYGNVMVSAVYGRTHEVCRTSVNTDVFFVDVLFVDRLCNERAERCEHEPAHLGIDRNIAHSCGNKDLIELLMYALTDDLDVVGGLVRPVVNSYAA